ncbi:MAG TPA: prepilin-type N-terminal cleavage/methylation domain-containing protein [Longimicrobium sp.]|nr:prepilin-type N-terminal cleavage/methylation domain-containing protein [Longimicrobium sp.]
MTTTNHRHDPRAGFTLLEVLLALFLTTLVLLASWSMFGAAGEQQLAGWREANRRSDLAAAERVLGRAISRAGTGMPGSANLGGVHVQAAGGAADTVYTFEGEGAPMRVAARTCPDSADGVCAVVLGDGRRGLAPGALVALGTAGAGLRLMRVAAPPTTFSAACGPDCLERILCALDYPGPGQAPAVAGSVLHAAAPASPPAPSPEPCPQPVLADGTTCTENETAVTVAPVSPAACASTGPAATYTRVYLAPAPGRGRPAPAVAPPRLGGARGTPAPLLQVLRVTRFWVRGADSALVKQTGPRPDGGWSTTQPVASHVVSLAAEVLHPGGEWSRGMGLPAGFLEHGAHNPNYVRGVPAPDAAPAAWRLRHGYHTAAAVRVTLELLRPAGPGDWTRERRSFVTATPAAGTGAPGEDVQ